MKFTSIFYIFLFIFTRTICADEGLLLDKNRSDVPESEKSLEVRKRQLGTSQKPGPLSLALNAAGFAAGDAVFIRIFKQQIAPTYYLKPGGKGVLEVWLQKKSDSNFSLFRTYEIAALSGDLGPKLEEGDRQAPEGFYAVVPGLLNPNSQYHLSMNIGYPNAYDVYHGRTGSYIMIHGSVVSIGCFAMTDPFIEEIYTLVESAFLNRQKKIAVHVFPFPLTTENMDEVVTLPWYSFWQNLKEGYDYFEDHKTVPQMKVSNGEYVIFKPN